MSQLHSQTTAITPNYISHTQLTNALNLRDLSDQQQGAHAMQRLIEEIDTPIVYDDVEPTPEQAALDAEAAATALGITPDHAHTVTAKGIFR